MTVYGYARVSTVDQNPQLQFDALRAAGITDACLYTDKTSGAASRRPALDRLLETVVAGDAIVVWKLDRLGRSNSHLVNLMADLAQREVDFRSLTDPIDTTTPAGRFAFHVFASMAEFERDLIVERTKAGLAAARASGRSPGPKPRITGALAQRVDELHDLGWSNAKIAATVQVSHQTIGRYLRAQEVAAVSR